MHKKGHLEERLSACSHILTVADLQDKNMKRAAEKKEYLNFYQIFNNNNPVHLEIGCGKGRFVIEMAKMYPDINFVAVEKVSNVIIDAAEGAIKQNLSNVYFLNCAAEVLPKYFEDGTVERIYLNFSNPLPKKGFIKQRLTHPKFLEIYKRILVPAGEIWQKTDSREFYEFSLQSYSDSGYEIVEKCEDLKNNPFVGNVVTEHESKFMAEGLPIYRVVAKVK
jgi:tRNA (guanine-N7-)-methyltransferase